jgi:putative transcription factor
MGECEVCGEEEAEFIVLIEGAKLHVCRDCAKRGRILAREAPPPKAAVAFAKEPARAESELELVADYAEKIRSARERMKLNIDVLAELVKEKESYLRRIEAGKALPSEELARRLEKELGIQLFESVSSSSAAAQSDKPGEITLGDMVVVKKSRKKD